MSPELMGHRRLRVLLRMLVEEEADLVDVKKMLSYSPSISIALIHGIQRTLAKAKAGGEAELAAALEKWKDIYSSVEEGQKAILRSKTVLAILSPEEEN